MSKVKKGDVGKWVEEVTARPCRVCENAPDEVKAAIAEFTAARKARRATSQRVPGWDRFVDTWIRGKLGFSVGRPVIERHVLQCLGEERL